MKLIMEFEIRLKNVVVQLLRHWEGGGGGGGGTPLHWLDHLYNNTNEFSADQQQLSTKLITICNW